MKKLVRLYLCALAVLDICWASFICYFGGSLLSVFGSAGNLSTPDQTTLTHSGSVLLFVVALLQSFVFDFIVTVALCIGFFFYAAFKSVTSK